jgi:3-deoxy-manno-octulosonate cytidylyltransferase (CMP-KDO synthetase)
MIRRVYEQVKKAKRINEVVVATDDTRIADHVGAFGGTVVMTRTDHPSGTDRCYEAHVNMNKRFDYVLNIQGDEPFILPEQIDQLAACLDGATEIATLVKPIELEDEIHNPGEVKVTVDKNNNALYFSRAAIPYLRNVPQEEWFRHHTFIKHIGLYAFRADVLRSISALPQSNLEQAESLEQLRWMENGYRVTVVHTTGESLCIETPDDIARALEYLKHQS